MLCNSKNCGATYTIKGLAHIGIFVSDMAVSKAFYTDILGFECYHETVLENKDGAIGLAFLRCGTCEIELVAIPGGEKRTDGIVDHIALTISDIDAATTCLKERGITFDTECPEKLHMVFDNGVKCIFFRGPDGERIELSEVL